MPDTTAPVPTPQMHAVLERLLVEDAGLPDPTTLPAAEGRALAERTNRRWNVDLPAMAEARDVGLAPGIAGRVLVPANDTGEGAILYIHGGGWAFCSMRTHERAARLLAVAAGAGRAYVYGGVPFRYAPAFTRAEAAARAAGRGLWGPPCRGRTSTTTTIAEDAPPPPAAGGEGRCDPNYRGACVPMYPPDVDCAAVGRPVTVVGADPHHLDGDGNGRGCEGYARR